MTENSINNFVYIDRSRIHGHGLFAARPISAGQMIGVYEGSEVKNDGIYVLWIEDDERGSWTGYNGENEMRFMNHSDEPNAEMDGLDCYALVDIARDAEITIDYGWEDS
jgi:hypothetical protein